MGHDLHQALLIFGSPLLKTHTHEHYVYLSCILSILNRGDNQCFMPLVFAR